MHPKHEVEKVYLATVTGYTPDNLLRLQNPVVLDGYQIRSPNVEVLSSSGNSATLRITIHEGRNRQVRRMCALAGMDVVRLIRVREGSVELGNVQSGKWRYLSDSEVESLRG
jgi:23S rRNA pseudouridine2605 synthase